MDSLFRIFIIILYYNIFGFRLGYVLLKATTSTRATKLTTHLINNNLPMLSVWYASCGKRKQVNTFAPVSSSSSSWNWSMGWVWFSDNQMALRLQRPRVTGRWCNLEKVKLQRSGYRGRC